MILFLAAVLIPGVYLAHLARTHGNDLRDRPTMLASLVYVAAVAVAVVLGEPIGPASYVAAAVAFVAGAAAMLRVTL